MNADINTLERLARQLRDNGAAEVADVIERAIGAPLSWPTYVAGDDQAHELYKGDEASISAFNSGVKWAVMHYEPTVAVIQAGRRWYSKGTATR